LNTFLQIFLKLFIIIFYIYKSECVCVCLYVQD
jgi:hypothetical protein